MSQACSISAHKRYGLQRVCRVWRVARSTLYARQARQAKLSAGHLVLSKRGPIGACSDEDLVGHIRRILKSSPFHAEGYRKVWAKLRFENIRVSKERIRRVMREYQLQAPHRAGHAHGPKAHDGTIITDTPDEMWGTDMTTVFTGEGNAAIFIAVDHCTCECVGIHAAARGDRFEALEPIRQGVREHFGAFTKKVAAGLGIRHDHGSQYMSDDFQDELKFLGIRSSPSFVREPQGNGCSERFIRTLKENLLWVRYFETIEQLRLALLKFKHQYNEQWIIQRHGYKTPSQVRQNHAMKQRVAA